MFNMFVVAFVAF